MYKELALCLGIGFAFTGTLFLIGIDEFEDSLSGFFFVVIVFGFMIGGSIFLVWIRKQNLKN